MLVNINYNKQIYRLLYEDKCAYWLDEPDEFKYILLDMCVSHPIINKCIVCHESKMGRYMNCCDYKQFMCVNCISQMYTLEMYDCPSCRKTFIYDLMFIIQHHSKYKKYKSKEWWARRKEAFEFLNHILIKNKLPRNRSLDYFITNLFNKFIKI